MKFYLRHSPEKKKYVIYNVTKITKTNDNLLSASPYLNVETYQILLKYKSIVSSVRLGAPLKGHLLVEGGLFETKKEVIIHSFKTQLFVHDENSDKFLKTCYRYLRRYYPEELL